MKPNTRLAILISTAFLSGASSISTVFSAEYVASSGAGSYHQKPDGAIVGVVPSTPEMGNDLTSFFETLSNSNNFEYKRAAQAAKEELNKPGIPRNKYNNAIQKFNEIVSVRKNLTEKEQQVLKIYHEQKADDPEIENLIDSLVFIKNSLDAKKEADKEKKGSLKSDDDKKETSNDKISIPVEVYNTLRKAVGLSEDNSGNTEILLEISELKKLHLMVAEKLKGEAEEGGQGKNLSPNQLFKIFTSQFWGMGYGERVNALEELINKFIEAGGGQQLVKNIPLELLKFLHNARMDAQGDENTRLYCTYFLQEFESNSLFANTMAEFNKWLNNSERNENIITCGESWNEIRKSGDVNKYSYSSINPYPKDNTAIPLISLLTKNFMSLLNKTDPSQLTIWGELIPHTPQKVIQAIYYNILRSNLDDEDKVEEKFAGEGFVKNKASKINAFVQQIKTAALSSSFKPRAFTPQQIKLQDSLHSIVGGNGRIDVWNGMSPNELKDFNKAAMNQAIKDAAPIKRVFKFNRNAISDFVPDAAVKNAPVQRQRKVKQTAKVTPEFSQNVENALKEVLGHNPDWGSMGKIGKELFCKKLINRIGSDTTPKKIKEELEKLKADDDLPF